MSDKLKAPVYYKKTGEQIFFDSLAENTFMENGTSVEEKINNIDNNISDLNNNLKESNEKIKDNTNNITSIKANYVKNSDIDTLINNKAEKSDLDITNTNVTKNTNDIAINSARIDSFTNLSEGSTTGDAELIDGRIGADGITYDNIGNAIREQFKKVAIFGDEDLTEELVWENNKWIRQNFIETSNYFKVAKIPVKEGDKFIISGTIYNWQSLFVVRNSDDIDRANGGGTGLLCYPNVSGATQNVPYKLIENYEFEIPTNGAYLYVNKYVGSNSTMGNEESFKLIRIGTGAKIKGQEKIKNNINKLLEDVSILNFDKENWKDRIIEEQLKNDFSWGNPDKCYVTFCFDDSLADISDIEDLFESKGVPCCFATIPNKLSNVTNSGETVKEVLTRCQNNGGEILSHWGNPLTSSSSDDDYYNIYIGAKKTLLENGFNVNGLITAGGTGFDTQDFNRCIKMARPYYRYTDLTDYNNTGVEQYLSRRCFLTTDNTTNKANIDTFISQGQLNRGGDLTYYGKYRWLPIASHGVNDNITIDILTELLDYIIAKGVNVIEIVTYKYLFDNFSSSKLEKRLLALENS